MATIVRLLIAILASVLLTFEASAKNKNTEVNCLAIIDQVKLFDGTCLSYFDSEGSFAIGQADNSDTVLVSLVKKIGFVAVKNRQTNKAILELQPAARFGACWVGANVRVCAWKLNEKRWFSKNDVSAPKLNNGENTVVLVKNEIKEKCASDWPSDYVMQAYCVERQQKAFLELN